MAAGPAVIIGGVPRDIEDNRAMKGMVAFGFFILFLGGLALVNLSNRVPVSKESARAVTLPELVRERWRLAALIDEPAAAGTAFEMQFTRGGAVSGNGGCLSFNASFELGRSAPLFRDIELFERACTEINPPPEIALMKVLRKTARITYDDRNIVLLAADQTRLARFGPVPLYNNQ
ncbi:MAG: META domain-containing protein [Woeseia sp.]|nr:META domain-containing protein [Woeseia sp.]